MGRFNNRLVADIGEAGEGEEEEGQGWEDDDLGGVEISKVRRGECFREWILKDYASNCLCVFPLLADGVPGHQGAVRDGEGDLAEPP